MKRRRYSGRAKGLSTQRGRVFIKMRKGGEEGPTSKNYPPHHLVFQGGKKRESMSSRGGESILKVDLS